jgi:hypothetical protein
MSPQALRAQEGDIRALDEGLGELPARALVNLWEGLELRLAIMS